MRDFFNKLCFFYLVFSGFYFSVELSAQTFYTKPDFPINGGEFGHSIAKNGKYIVASSDRHAEFGRSPSFSYDDWGSQRNFDNGAIYLIADDGSEPVRKYQYLKSPSVPPTHANSEYVAAITNFGSQVAISDNWIAAVAPKYGLLMKPAIILIPKVAGVFPTCPEVQYVTGLPGNPATQKNWGNAVDCSSLTAVGGGTSTPIQAIMLPSGFSVGRNTMVRLSDDVLVVSDGGIVLAANKSMGQWIFGFSFSSGPGKKISDVALHGQNLAIGMTSIQDPITYQDTNGVLEPSDFIFDTTGQVHTFKMTASGVITMGIITEALVGAGRRLAMNENTLMISAGGLSYPDKYYELYPHTKTSFPVPKGYVYQYLLSPSGLSWSYRGYSEYSSTPTSLKLSADIFAVQLKEMGMYELGTGSQYTYVFNPNAVAIIYRRSDSDERRFEHGMWHGQPVTRSQIESARPWYAYVTPAPGYGPNQFSAGGPMDISNESIVFGWKAVRGDNTTNYELTGGIFDLKLNSIW